ncbi:MAG: hypothetical protein DRJ35_03445 [Thermoprotei archaeon]|nr:MAG: hypothetical protein DRJ35_03445 [Thermoprotei archaeon]
MKTFPSLVEGLGHMVLNRIRFVQKRLIRRYKEIGIVASQYLEAGLSVRVNHPTRLGPVHVFAQGSGQRLVIEVYKDNRPAGTEVVERVMEKAKLLRSKPILVLYGNAGNLTSDAFEKAKELGVKVRRIRPEQLSHDVMPR